MIDPLHRRTFLTLLGVAGTAGASPAWAMSGTARELVLVDTRLTKSERATIPLGSRNGFFPIDHGDVLIWRRELTRQLKNGVAITAYTYWDLALLLPDLGRESGCSHRCDRAQGSVMVSRLGQ